MISALVALATLGCGEAKKLPEPDAWQADPDARAAPEKTPLTEAEAEQLVVKWGELLDSEPDYPKTDKFAVAKEELQRVANEAADAHLRANASLLLGALHEARGERTLAIDFYRHASKLVTNDAGPFMALALALDAEKKYPEAIEAQKEATKRDPNNLENWLVLGELFIKSGDEESAKKAYVDYEAARKSLIDGLTLKQGDKYRVAVKERIAIAEALGSAADGGTGVALLYSLNTEPEASVRETVARVMGIQRLSMYADPLRKHVETEKDPAVQEAIKWALEEIARDPVEAKPPVPSKAGDAEAPDLVKPPGDAPTKGAPAEPDG